MSVLSGLSEILDKHELSKEDTERILSAESEEELSHIAAKAREVAGQHVGNKVYFRGLIEFSNLCEKDCFYCGIRKSNKKVKRYIMPKEKIVSTALWAFEKGYGSIVLQSGELTSERMVDFIESVVAEIKSKSIEMDKNGRGLGITLCVGEQSEETYKRFFEAGAHRYLLRIETSNPKLYAAIHPPGYSWKKRFECLKSLRKIGYQVGTGVMIGLPGQTISDLADDVLFFEKNDIDMVGMGPYIIHKDTPLALKVRDWYERKKEIFLLALKMIAATRLCLKDVNIAATTALQAIDPFGREKGIQFGANVVMPLITPAPYRKNYLLYENKPCVEEGGEDCTECLSKRVKMVGREVGLGEWGDSPHFFKRRKTYGAGG